MRAHHLAGAVDALAVAAWIALAAALVPRWPALVGWGLTLFGGEYALFLALRGGAVDSSSVLLGAASLLAAELAFVSLDAGLVGAQRAFLVRASVRIVGAVAAAAAVGALLLVASTSARPRLFLVAIGAAAAVGAVALVAWAASRTRDSTST